MFVSLLKKQLMSLLAFAAAFAVAYWIQIYYGFRDPIIITKDLLIGLTGPVVGYLLVLPLLKYVMFKKGWEGF